MPQLISKLPEWRKKWLMDNSLGNYKLKENELFSRTLDSVLCKTCHKPLRRLAFKEEIGKDVYMPIDNAMCDCMVKANEAADETAKRLRIKSVMNGEMYLRSVGLKFRHASFEKLDPGLMTGSTMKNAECIKTWCDGYKPGVPGWSLTGDVGLGKTRIASCVRNALLDNGVSCMLATAKQIVDDISDRVDRDDFSFNTYRISDVLIIDDICADFDAANERRSSYFNSVLYDLINYRYVNMLTVCYTSNLSRAEMIKAKMDKRIVDRFSEMIALDLRMEGVSVRGDV